VIAVAVVLRAIMIVIQTTLPLHQKKNGSIIKSGQAHKWKRLIRNRNREVILRQEGTWKIIIKQNLKTNTDKKILLRLMKEGILLLTLCFVLSVKIILRQGKLMSTASIAKKINLCCYLKAEESITMRIQNGDTNKRGSIKNSWNLRFT